MSTDVFILKVTNLLRTSGLISAVSIASPIRVISPDPLLLITSENHLPNGKSAIIKIYPGKLIREDKDPRVLKSASLHSFST